MKNKLKFIIPILFTMVLLFSSSIFATEVLVRNAPELISAAADPSIDTITLIGNVILTSTNSTNLVINVDGYDRTINLHSFSIISREGRSAIPIHFGSANNTLTFTDDQAYGQASYYSGFAAIDNNYDNNKIIVNDVKFTDNGGSKAFTASGSKEVSIVIESAKAYYASGSVFGDGYGLSILNFEVIGRSGQTDNVYLYDGTKTVSQIIPNTQDIYVGNEIVEIDRTSTLANTLYYSSDNCYYGIKVVDKPIEGMVKISFAITGDTQMDPILVAKDELMEEPASPTYNGYVFGGWYFNLPQTLKVDFTTFKPSEDTTLYAKWYRSYTITAYDKTSSTEESGGKVKEANTSMTPVAKVVNQEFESDATITYEAIPDENYEFLEWRKGSPSGEVYSTQTTATITGDDAIDLKLYAIFRVIPSERTITHDYNGGTNLGYPTRLNVATGTVITFNQTYFDNIKEAVRPPSTYTIDCIEINGARYGLNSTYTVNTDVTFKFIWKYEPNVTVTFDTDDDPVMDSIVVERGTKISKPENIRNLAGYFASSWYRLLYSGDKVYFDFDNDTVDFDMTLHPNWVGKYSLTAYDITKDSRFSGGKIKNVNSDLHPYGAYGESGNILEDDDTYTFNAIPDVDYRFVEWRVNSYDGEVYSTEPTISFDYSDVYVKLYAIFEEVVIHYEDNIELTVDAIPYVGQTITTQKNGDNWDYASQTNKPTASAPSGRHYVVVPEKTVWVNGESDWTPFNGTFEADTDYYIRVFLRTTDNYVFDSNIRISEVNGAEFVRRGYGYNNYTEYTLIVKVHSEERPAFIKGDLDRNGVVDANDASVALELYKAQNATAEDIQVGDMDNNQLIDANDASLILEYYKTHQ